MRARRAASCVLTLGTSLVLLLSCTMGCAPVRAVPRFTFERRAAPRPERPDRTEHETPAVYLVLRLGERRLRVMQANAGDGASRPVDSFPVAVGRPEYPTPIGNFHVTDMSMHPPFLLFDWEDPTSVTGMMPPGPSNPLGLRWIGFASAHGWDIGFHGTPNPELIGQAVSHGCVRLHNRDVVALYELVRVGTTVIVQP
jgi:lipoprotein-anchoring transpeptidase ErfK/SrfK